MSVGARRHGVGILCLVAVGLGLWLTRETGARSGRGPTRPSPGIADSPAARLPPLLWAEGSPEGRVAAPAGAPSLAYTYRRRASLGDPAPGGSPFASDFEISDLNDAGEFPLVSDDARGEALYFVSPRGVVKVAGAGDATPGGSRYGGIVWTPQAINNRGQIAWAGVVESGETWIFFHDGRTGRGSVVARPGMAAPGGGVFHPGGRLRPEINDRGDVVFSAQVGDDPAPQAAPAGGGYPGGGVPGGYSPSAPPEAMWGVPSSPGVFLLAADGPRVVARPGMSIHSGAIFTGATAPSINNAGAVVFHASASDREGLGVYLWEEGFFTPIATPGERFQQAYAPQIDDLGRVVFVGRTGRGDALYRWENGVERPIIAAGDPVPGVGRLRWLDLNRRQPFRLNARGAVAFTGDVSGRTGIFVWDDGRIRCVALSGATLTGAGEASEVGSLSTPGPTPPGPGGLAPEIATRSPGYPSGANPGVNVPSAPYPGAGPPGRDRPIPGPPGSGSPGYRRPPGTSGAYGPYGAYGAPGGYGPPGGGPFPGAPRGGGGSFGLALSDSGRLLFAATLRGRQSVVLATPKRE